MCSLLFVLHYVHQAGYELRKVKTENLKFRTDVQGQVINLVFVGQHTEHVIFSSRLLKKSLDQKSKLAGLSKDFSYLVAFATILAANLVAIESPSCQRSFQALMHRQLKWLCCLIGTLRATWPCCPAGDEQEENWPESGSEGHWGANRH